MSNTWKLFLEPRSVPRDVLDLVFEDIMSKEKKLRFVDENDFETLGKCYFLSNNSNWENASISLVSDDSLDGISDFSEELESD